jgi:cyclic pyranopterin phosphate synthase
VSADEMIAGLEKFVALRPVAVPHDSTSFVFETPEGARLGFIASESKPFCGTCSRLRLSATGTLRSCLMSERGVSLRNVPPSGYGDVLGRVMAMKPTGRLDHGGRHGAASDSNHRPRCPTGTGCWDLVSSTGFRSGRTGC